jgi:nucleoside-diphosphate-sugar epimerase
MNVLVTGSEGYIGSVLVPYLLEAGHEVVGLDAGYLAHRRFIGQVAPHEVMKRDIRDVSAAELREFDAICHLAAVSNDPAGELSPYVTDDVNYRGTLTLAKRAIAAHVSRFVFSGSCSVYGAGDMTAYLTEDAQFNPITAYAKSKVLAEQGLRRLAQVDFCPIYLRNATVYGVSPKLRLDLVVNNLVALAYTAKEIAMTSDGTPWRPLIHIQDVCLAFKCALEAPTTAVYNEAFNVGRTDANYQIREIANAISTVISDAVITFNRQANQNPDARTYRVSFEKAAHKLPGFIPQRTLLDGINELYASYKAFGLQKQHLYGDEFITLHAYKMLLEEGKIGPDFRWV